MAYKKSSELVAISDSVTSANGNDFTEKEISLPLDTLRREIFVVTDIMIDVDTPNTAVGQNANCSASLSSTSKTGVPNISDTQCLSVVRENFISMTAEGSLYHTKLPDHLNSTGTARDNLGIIATPNFFAQIVGFGNTSAKAAHFRLIGYRAIADADTYAALVASEVLSA